MTVSIVAGVEVDWDQLAEYNWYNQKITVNGQEYRLLHGYMAAYLVEISSVNTVATTAAASAGAARDQVLAVQAAIVAANELTVQTTAGHVQDAEAARDAAEQAAIDAEADRVAAEAAAASIAGGPVASVNGRSGVVVGVAEADLSNVTNEDFAAKATAAGIGAGGALFEVFATKTANYAIVADDDRTYFRASGASTFTLLAAATAGAQFYFGIRNVGSDAIVLNASGVGNFDGNAATTKWVLQPGLSAIVLCNATTWTVIGDGYGVSDGTAYVLGGVSGSSHTTEIDGLALATDTATNPTAVLAVARARTTAVNSVDAGYALAGWNGSNSSEIDGITFATEAARNPAASITTIEGGAGLNSLIKGYLCGGYNSGYASGIHVFTFATEAVSAFGGGLSSSRYQAGGMCSATAGYVAGGETATNTMSTAVDRLTFASDTIAAASNGLGTSSAYAASMNSPTRGYLAGGRSTAGGTTSLAAMQGYRFDTETAVSITDVLSLARHTPAGANSSVKGYAMGGSISNGGTAYNEIDGITFATETLVNPSDTLAVARAWGAGVQSGGFL